MARVRKKSWQQKVKIVQNSFLRSSQDLSFARIFYENLFFLNPVIKDYFSNTDFPHQEKALMRGLEFLIAFLDQTDENARRQILRIATSHSASGMKIHPHQYYYWIEALIMTVKKLDKDWYQDQEYYWREVITFPTSFIISQYFNK